MADPTKRPSVASSAMVDLKAELHRKQEEFRRLKSDKDQFVKGRKFEKPKTSLWSQQNPGIYERASKDIEEKQEDEDELLKSRRMLAHKSRLYEEISSNKSIPDDDGSEGFLVDFQKKAVDRIVDEREKQRKTNEEKKEEEAERKALTEPIPEAADSDEEWVDFTDSLGRSRCCMKKDLNHVKRRDKEFLSGTSSIDKGENQNTERLGPEYPDLMSSDMHREKIRQKWENEVQELLDKGQNDIHYSNVQFDEIRSHGVGFYQFSKDHKSREDQLEQLKKLRDQTVSETSRHQHIKDKRKAMMEERLAKVRDRRKLREAVSDNTKEDVHAAAEAAKKAKEEEEERKKKEEAAEVKSNHIREWDKNKQKNIWPGQGYVKSRRSEREAEFGPPSVYFENTGGRSKQSTQSLDQFRIDRLKSVPPPSYFNEGNEPIGCQQEKGKDLTHTSTFSIDSSNTSLNFVKELKKCTTTSNISETVCDISIGSIPLPGENKSVFTTQDNRSLSSFMQTPVKHFTGKQHGVDINDQNDWQLPQHHFTQYNQSKNQTRHQHHHHHQQYLHYRQQPQQTTFDQWTLCQQHQFISQNPDQQGQQLQQEQHQQQHQQVLLSGQSSKRRPLGDREDKWVVGKAKVPKTSIMDMRFMLNEHSPPSEDLNTSTFEPLQAVSYEPGSFTAARFAHTMQSDDLSQDPCLPVGKMTQISGGPKLYSQKQQEEQQKQLEERCSRKGEGNDGEAEQKLQDFLASIRAETS